MTGSSRSRTSVPRRDEGSRHGRTSPRAGTVYWEARPPATAGGHRFSRLQHRPARRHVVFFRGNAATLERDVIARQQVPRQIAEVRAERMLLAPQFALTRSIQLGNFWTWFLARSSTVSPRWRGL
jgi:hypothetical protein